MVAKRPVVLLPFAPPQTRRVIAAGLVLAKRAWALYNHNLVVKPVSTRAVSAVAGLVTGDAIAQVASGDKFDPGRSLRMAVYAFCIHGPVCYKVYNAMDKIILPARPTSWAAVAAKTLVDQVFFSPPLLCVYLSLMKALEGSPQDSLATIREKAWPCTSAGFCFWIPAHVVNFKLVPDAYRSLIVLSFGVAWTAILSSLSSQKAPAQVMDPMDSFLLDKAPLVAAQVFESQDYIVADQVLPAPVPQMLEQVSSPMGFESAEQAPVVATQIVEPADGSFPTSNDLKIAIQASM